MGVVNPISVALPVIFFAVGIYFLRHGPSITADAERHRPERAPNAWMGWHGPFGLKFISVVFLLFGVFLTVRLVVLAFGI